MVTATFDPAHGGRWTSLSAAGREWLWHRPAVNAAGPASAPARSASAAVGPASAPAGPAPTSASEPGPARSSVRPGAAFVDAGGVEECIPTIRGVPDHGDAWSRPWAMLSPETAVV